MSSSRYSPVPTVAKLDENTAKLKAKLDRLETTAGSQPPAGSEAAFFSALKNRLKAGQEAYGDRSFSRDPSELYDELEAEALDLAGWSYVLFVRIRKAKAALDAVGAAHERAVKEGS